MEKLCFPTFAIVFLWLFIIHTVTFASTPHVNLTCEYEGMTRFLQEIAANYSHIAHLIPIGTTKEGRELWTMIVSDSPHTRPLLRPQVKFVGNVNGMSGPACYVLLRFIQNLVEEYESEASMERKLLESVEIHIIPNFSPDGYAKAIPGSCSGREGRLNANSVDLNTNFPDIFNDNEEPFHDIQEETTALMRWMGINSFTISLSIISGARVVVYPFDAVIITDETGGIPEFGEAHPTPDNDIFKHLALLYAKKTKTPEMGWFCPRVQRQFPQGIVNGAEWEPKSGTMMDYNYIHGTFEIMVGLSCCRNEDNSTILEELWWENREGLLHVIHEVGTGIRGQVLDAETYDAIADANLSQKEYDYIEGEDTVFSLPWYTTKQGEFWRPWRPGHHKLRVEKMGYKTKVVNVHVQRHQPTFIRVEMERVASTQIHQVSTTPSSNQGPGQNESIKKMTSSDQTDDFFSLGKGETEMNDYEHTVRTTTATTVSGTTNASVQEEPVVKSSKRYSSLTQLDHSFINLFRGIQLGNDCSSIKDCCCNRLIIIFMVGLLVYRYQLAEK